VADIPSPVTFRDGDRAIAVRNRTASGDELRSALDRMQALRQLAARAGAWARAAGSWLRSDEESISFCSRCDARIYLRVASPPVSDGEVHFRAVPGAVVRGDHPRTRSDPGRS
jgi:hypothetical protein